MKITWIGQPGLLFETDGVNIIVDPYLSNSYGKINSASNRRMPINEKFLNIKPDVLALTLDHLDHTDEETLDHYHGKKQMFWYLLPIIQVVRLQMQPHCNLRLLVLTLKY